MIQFLEKACIRARIFPRSIKCLRARAKQMHLNAFVEDEDPIRIPSSVYRRDTANDHQSQD